METTEIRQNLVEEAESAKEFRTEKAKEHPEDERNQTSMAALDRLMAHIRDLPEDDPLVHAWGRLGDDPDATLRVTEEVLSGQGVTASRFARMGFDQPEDPEAFCASLARDINQVLDAA